MKQFISTLVLVAALIVIGLACGGEVQNVTFNELFASPDQYNGRDILLEGFYFDGWETTVLSEKLEYT